MKLTRKLFTSMIAVLFCALALATSTYAWFSMNSTATVTGMQVTAVADGNLVIETAPTWGSTNTKVDFGSTLFKMKPMTEQWKIVANPEVIDIATGLAKEGEEIEYKEITAAKFAESTEAEPGYYKDYVVYLASAGEALEDQKLTFTIKYDDTDLDQMYKKATTIAVYIGAAVDEVISYDATDTTYGYAGTPAEIINILDTKDTSGEQIYITLSESIDIPSNTTADAGLPVLMRVYFDGALTGTEETYVKVDSPSATAGLYVLAGGVYTEATGDVQVGITYYEKKETTIAYINTANFIEPTNFTLSVEFKVEEAE